MPRREPPQRERRIRVAHLAIRLHLHTIHQHDSLVDESTNRLTQPTELLHAPPIDAIA